VEENVIFSDNDVAGSTKFAFTTHMDEEEYLFCFTDVPSKFVDDRDSEERVDDMLICRTRHWLLSITVRSHSFVSSF
jgi:hypothetical protein